MNMPFVDMFLIRSLEIGGTVEITIDVTKCVNITSLEHVTANVSYSFHRRGDVKVTLISPSQTPSEMISYRDNDATDRGTSIYRLDRDVVHRARSLC
jgi:subtilisin-like proprotein convertase family protein